MIAQVQELLSSLAISFDLPVLEFIRNYLTNSFMDKAMPIVTLFGDGGVFWIAIAVLLLVFPKSRKTGWSMLAAMALGLIVCNIILKPMIARPRPYVFYAENVEGWQAVKLLVKTPSDFSFPSGHTIASFEACTVLLMKNKWVGIPATILAFLIAFSRLYLYVHYPTDVIVSFFGGILFALLGSLIVVIIYKLAPPKRGKYEALEACSPVSGCRANVRQPQSASILRHHTTAMRASGGRRR